MAAANTDKWRKKKSRFSTTLNGSITDSDVVMTLNSVSGLPTDTGVTLIINRVDANGTATPSAMEVVTGIVSGSTIASLVRAEDGTTARAHASGSIVEMVFEGDGWNDAIDSFLAQHNQDGTHKATAISVITHAATEKTTPVDSDEFTLLDSAASYVLKRLTWANLKATIKSYYDSVTATLTNKTLTKPVVNAHAPGYQSYTPSGGATATLDCSLADRHLITMPAGNITIALSNVTTGQYIQVEITQDSGGSRTVTWFSTIKWAGGSAPTLTTTGNKRDVLGFICTGTNTYDGYIIGQNI